MDAIVQLLKRQLTGDAHVIFAYLFGSQANGNIGALSDIDIAIFLDDRVDPLYYRLKLIEACVRLTKMKHVDIVVLNQATPLLKHEVIRSNMILKESSDERLLFETEVLREYLDSEILRKVQRSYIKGQLRAGNYFG